MNAQGDIEVRAVARKAAGGVLALGARQVLVQGMNILGAVILGRLLSPAEFGLFGITTFVLGFLVAFGDVGLGGSLIRQAEEPNEADYRAIFTVQQALVAVVVTTAWIAAPWIAHGYGLAPMDAWIFRTVALSLLCTSFQVIPAVRLERHLQFKKLATVEVAQALVYNACAVLMAWRHMGPLSFAIALLLRSMLGAALANAISPWALGWSWDWQRVREHMAFGLPYQGIAVISLIKDSITPVFVGLLLGPAQVGYLNWANTYAAYPVLALMVLQRIYLPAFARMQGSTDGLRRFIESAIRATNGIVAPLAVLTLVFSEAITRIVFGEKWLVALPLFYLFWAANIFVATASPVAGLLNALGRSRTMLTFAVIWMVGTWGLGAPLVVRYGALGFPIANLIVQFSNLLLYSVAQREVRFRIWPLVWPVWGWASVVGLAMYGIQRMVTPNGVFGLAIYICLGLTLYGAGMAAFYPSDIKAVLGLMRRSV